MHSIPSGALPPESRHAFGIPAKYLVTLGCGGGTSRRDEPRNETLEVHPSSAAANLSFLGFSQGACYQVPSSSVPADQRDKTEDGDANSEHRRRPQPNQPPPFAAPSRAARCCRKRTANADEPPSEPSDTQPHRSIAHHSYGSVRNPRSDLARLSQVPAGKSSSPRVATPDPLDSRELSLSSQARPANCPLGRNIRCPFLGRDGRR